jgi:hypothetical protein
VKKLAFLALVLAACTEGGSPSGESSPLPGSPAATYVPLVNHQYFPLLPGSTWTYIGEEDGESKREEVRVLDGPHMVLGVACTAVVEDVFVDGELAETTTQWYAQDTDGNVWVFGEESLEYTGGVPVPADDSWRAGVNGAQAWIVFAAHPQPGDVYAGNRGDGWDENTVVSVTATALVPAGMFQGCLDLEEGNPDDPDDQDRILYAPGVGRVSEEAPDGRVELVSFAN